MTKMAMCPHCGEPLIATLVFSKKEFYCLACGRKWGFLEPRPADPTPEVTARHAELQAEWNEHAGPKLRVIDAWIRDCEKCDPSKRPVEYHAAHATPEERQAHDEALAWLKERASG